MRRRDHLRQLRERPVLRRLLLEHVQAGAFDDAAVDGAAERRFVDQLASGGVDEPEPRLAARESRIVEEMPGFGCRRQVQRDVVGGRAERVERQKLDAQARRHLGRDDTDRGRRFACRRPRALRRPPGRSGPDRRCRASCRGARFRESASFPSGRPSWRDRRPAPGAPAPASSASACSATLMLLAPGALTTSTPRALAAATSTLSTPVPARATIRSCGAASSSRASTCVALRTISASASARSAASAAGVRPGAGIDHPAGFGAKQIERGGREVVGNDNFQWVGVVSVCRVHLRRPT